MVFIPILILLPDLTHKFVMLNFFPSPVECLIYRANNDPNKIREIAENKNESSRKILNEMSNLSSQVEIKNSIEFKNLKNIENN